jgi:epoxyqueuosine reductase
MKLTNEIVKRLARKIGFDLVGFAKADQLENEGEHIQQWLDKKYHAGMEYMERNLEKRKDLKLIFSEARSVISLGLNYYTKHHHSDNKTSGKVSRYAWGKDYHLIIWSMLDELESELKKVDPHFESISYVDTGPVMDKAWAVRAGLGWLGKHTNVINREIGSWFFIANIISNYDFEYSEAVADFCGSCNACIDACPTDAIIPEYVVNANKCISYLTIENKAEIPDEFRGQFENWLFGCDICQDVCPWNIKFQVESAVKDFQPRNIEFQPDEVLSMNPEEFRERFKDSPIKRAKLDGLKRNAEFLKSS